MNEAIVVVFKVKIKLELITLESKINDIVKMNNGAYNENINSLTKKHIEKQNKLRHLLNERETDLVVAMNNKISSVLDNYQEEQSIDVICETNGIIKNKNKNITDITDIILKQLLEN